DITGRTTPWRTNDRASRSAHVGLADTALPYRPDSCQAAEIGAGDVTVRPHRPDSYLRAASLLLAGGDLCIAGPASTVLPEVSDILQATALGLRSKDVAEGERTDRQREKDCERHGTAQDGQ